MNLAGLFKQENISFLLFLFINFNFCVKYSSRVTDWYLLFSVLIVAFYFFIWKYKYYLSKTSNLQIFNLFIILIFVCGSIYGFSKIPVESLNVDRWSVITSFWDTYISGEYAYFAEAHTGNPPGPMPFYFLLALPFYLIGELGLFSLLGLLVFYFLLKYEKIPIYIITISLILVCTSIFYLWEVFSRSNIFINSTLVLLSIIYFNRKELTLKRIILTGVCTGLLMSTRNVFIIPYIITFLFAWRNGKITFGKLALMGIITIIVFVLTFLPIVIGHFADFKVMNPFIVQSTFLIPFGYTVGFVALAFIFGILCKKVENVYFYSGITLFISIAVYFLFHFQKSGFQQTYFDSIGDLSYFILCVPFLFYYSIVKTFQSK